VAGAAVFNVDVGGGLVFHTADLTDLTDGADTLTA
jgi:hypothetical protein